MHVGIGGHAGHRLHLGLATRLRSGRCCHHPGLLGLLVLAADVDLARPVVTNEDGPQADTGEPSEIISAASCSVISSRRRIRRP